ncbi:Uncharacterised protein [Mycobacteroides abscessus subsp. abscessus]|nr:Uncharacterised protein [Mycobacteroides abscessus subsp. abscessus]
MAGSATATPGNEVVCRQSNTGVSGTLASPVAAAPRAAARLVRRLA